jgi:predicted DNA-binding transcriptional regulator YafY
VNRTDRLLAIVLELQARGRQRAEDLAATFETSKRTIYRDIEALSEAGVPLVAVPGQGYSLMEGYFLPPLTFSADEAAMLSLGSDVMAGSFDRQYRAAAETAGRKIAGVLPEGLRSEVAALRESIVFVQARGTPEERFLAQLRQAILERRAVRFRYHTRHRAEGSAAPATREVNPYTLIHVQGAWYLTGHDGMRGQVRTFRLDRMEDLTELERTFARPEGLQVHRPHGDDRPIEVRALFAPEVVRWVREARSFFTTAEEETPEGLLLTLHVRQESEILAWLLGWGRHVRVLAPESLRQSMAEEARALLQAHKSEHLPPESYPS